MQSPAQPSPNHLLEEWQTWLLAERNLSKETAKMYGWRIGHLLRLSGTDPLEIQTSDLRKHLLEVCPAANTKGAALRAFRSFFGFLASEGYRTDDPSRKVRQPKVPQMLPKYLSPDEAAGLDEASYWEGIQTHALCRVYLYGGLRATEACRLAWRQPTKAEDPDDLCTGVVSLDEGWIRVLGKGSKERDLPMHPKVREALKRLYKYRKHDVWVFSRKANALRPGQENLPITKSCAQQAVKRWAIAAGIDPNRVSLHKLRHTFATGYLSAGVDITYVQAALGHSDIRMTMRYARVRKEDLKRTIGKLKY
ncbi:MAG: tyrosine-type recombinase/integrase [Actinomycetota bacterium]|nr:tyrosine-type recombinase/integrase [Actinomycetota bacterium]